MVGFASVARSRRGIDLEQHLSFFQTVSGRLKGLLSKDRASPPRSPNWPAGDAALSAALKETQEALFRTQHLLGAQGENKDQEIAELRTAFRQTQDALFETQELLAGHLQLKDRELSELRKAFENTQAALFHTQKVLRDQQVSCGLIDPVSEETIAPDRSLPSIFLVCPPKSAGSYIMHRLQRGLGLERRWITNGTFWPDLIRQGSLDQFRRTGGCIAFHHTEASSLNLFLLGQTDVKVLINLRDPRQCMLSAIHYALRHFPRGDRLVDPHEPPADFEAWSLERQIDWALDTLLEKYIAWIGGWRAAIESGQVKALETEYADMVRDETAFFRNILTFYGIPEDKLKAADLALDDTVNYRKGEVNEWDRVFTPAQKQRARAMIPEHLANRFGWLY